MNELRAAFAPGCRPAPIAALLLLGLIAWGGSIGGAAPVRGLSRLPARPLSAGYLNAIRRGTGNAAQQMAALNYEGVDIVLLAFTLLNADGSLDFAYGNSDLYRPYLIPRAHAHSRSVVMSIVGDFETVSAAVSLRQAAATNIANALETYGFDGADFDWEWPDTAGERTQFTLLMQAVHAAVKARSPDYIISFAQGPGYWLAGTDWSAVRDYTDFCFCMAYDWKNPANGPIRKPGSVQYLGLDGGTIEAAAKGAVDYITAHGYPADQIIVGLPFYSSDNRSWFNGEPTWSANRIGYLNASDPDYREVEFDSAWWMTPDNIKQKMNALLDRRQTVLAGGATVRGIGFWEFGHEDLANPQLTRAIHEWRAGDRSLGGLASPPPTNLAVLVDAGASWRYLDTGVALAASWTALAFDDSAWPAGLAPLGYGDGDEATVVSYGPSATNKYVTTYFRHAFTLADTSAIHVLTLRVLRDDGAVVYLNGTEVFRSNLPTGAIAQATLALNAVSGPEERTLYHTWAVAPSLLVSGTNILAVRVHQSAVTSTDISFDLQLLAQMDPARLTLVPPRAIWRYLDAGTNPGAAWLTRTYNDGAWFEGKARLGYGGDGELTSLLFGSDAASKPITCYFRHAFLAEDATMLGPLRLQMQRDDGAVVYLNGAEVFRANMPAGVVTPATLASSAIAGVDETNWIRAPLPATTLVAGTNVIAVEVHQAAATSSDLGLDLELSAVLQPRLTIARNRSLCVLRWPVAAPGFQVQYTDSLASPVTWQPYPYAPSVNGPWYQVQAVPVGSRFYRLSAP